MVAAVRRRPHPPFELIVRGPRARLVELHDGPPVRVVVSRSNSYRTRSPLVPSQITSALTTSSRTSPSTSVDQLEPSTLLSRNRRGDRSGSPKPRPRRRRGRRGKRDPAGDSLVSLASALVAAHGARVSPRRALVGEPAFDQVYGAAQTAIAVTFAPAAKVVEAETCQVDVETGSEMNGSPVPLNPPEMTRVPDGHTASEEPTP